MQDFFCVILLIKNKKKNRNYSKVKGKKYDNFIVKYVDKTTIKRKDDVNDKPSIKHLFIMLSFLCMLKKEK